MLSELLLRATIGWRIQPPAAEDRATPNRFNECQPREGTPKLAAGSAGACSASKPLGVMFEDISQREILFRVVKWRVACDGD